jgi:catechol 2,3-dioxygenase-like lactoylglutathione lyase family enzyme
MKSKFNVKAQFTHVALHVKDTKKSSKFYKKWAGMNVVHKHHSQGDNQDVVWMASPGMEESFVIVLVPGASENKKQKSMSHIGISVANKKEVKKIAEKAKKEGLLHWDYATYKWPVGTLCSLTDPDGYILEISCDQPLGPDFKAHKKNKGPN